MKNIVKFCCLVSLIVLGSLPAIGAQINAAASQTDLRKAADQGQAEAQFYLGVMYAKGQGVPQDDAEAAKWYRKAADHGIAEAQHNVGNMYYGGRGVPQDYAEAAKWYRKAADQGYADAQDNLGIMYAKGQGVPQDDAEAAKWWRKAAGQGNAEAQNNLRIIANKDQAFLDKYNEIKRAEANAARGITNAEADQEVANHTLAAQNTNGNNIFEIPAAYQPTGTAMYDSDYQICSHLNTLGIDDCVSA